MALLPESQALFSSSQDHSMHHKTMTVKSDKIQGGQRRDKMDRKPDRRQEHKGSR